MDVKSLFDAWAHRTDKKYAHRQWMLSKWENIDGIEWPADKVNLMVRNIRAGLEPGPTDVVFDLGCGGGWVSQEMLPFVGKLLGLDFSFHMLVTAKGVCPDNSFICGRIEQMPFKDNACDCVICYFVFINILNDDIVQKSILDILRVLKPGGRALIGQLPDMSCSADFDKAKEDYKRYCRDAYDLREDLRDICHVPQKLFNKQALEEFLVRQNISYEFRNSFNPFYRQGQPETVDWRFDIILHKK